MGEKKPDLFPEPRRLSAKEVMSNRLSLFDFKARIVIYSAFAKQSKWVSDYSAWALAGTGVFLGLILTNLDKLRLAFCGNWKTPTIVLLILSILLGGVIRFFLAYIDAILELQARLEPGVDLVVKDYAKLLVKTGAAPNEDIAVTVADRELTPLVLSVVVNILPRRLRFLSDGLIRKALDELDWTLRRAAQAFFLSLLVLVLQVTPIIVAPVWSMLRLRHHQ
jgi:hypothetical protein